MLTIHCAMPILYLDTRDELIIFKCDYIAYFRADHNYTTAVYINGTKQVVCKGISYIEQQLLPLYAQNSFPFVRIGRSFLINAALVLSVSLPKQCLLLSDCREHTIALSIPRATLKSYKHLFNLCSHSISSTKVADSDMNPAPSDINK